jgi:tetratricopeptide (TPR) repeat protein
MKKAAFCLLLVVCVGFGGTRQSGAEEEVQSLPARFLKLAEQSKLVYQIGNAPVKQPVQDVSCEGTAANYRAIGVGSAKVELVPWPPKPDARSHFEEAEKLYTAQKMDEALEAYDKGLALDPEYGPGWLFSGDVPFHKGDHAGALARYRRAIALDPTLAIAHRFAAHALDRLGRYGEARDEYLTALLYRPAYQEADKALRSLALQTDFWVRRVPFNPPPGLVGEREGKNVPVGFLLEDTSVAPGWVSYAMCKAIWRHEDGYRAERLGRKEPYRFTFEEELECTTAYIQDRLLSLDDGADDRGKSAGTKGDAMTEDPLAAAPKDLKTLVEISNAGLLQGYVLVENLGRRCPDIMRRLSPSGLEAARRYLWESVIVHDDKGAPAMPAATPGPQPSPPTPGPPGDPTRG